jgi:hypothetical protein
VETSTTGLARHAGFDRQSQSTTVPLARRLRRSIHPAAALSPVAITGISSSPTSTPIIYILSRVPLHHRSIDNISHASGQSGGTGGQPPDYKSAQKRIYFVSN